MNKVNKLKILICVLLFISEISLGQTSITSIGTVYSQNFDALTTSLTLVTWTDNSTLPGWYARTDATSTITQYRANTGSNATAGLYSFGTTGSTERSLGFCPTVAFTGTSGVGKGYLGWRLKNNTGKNIGTIRVVWTGEQWRKAVDANPQYIVLSYQISGSAITNLTQGTFVETSSTFESPIFNSNPAVALVGNEAANRVENITIDIDVDFPDGSEIMIRWDDLNNPANHTLAIDDVSFTATKENQSINFDPLADKTYGDSPFDLTATSTSGLPITYQSSNVNVATIDGSTVTITGAGTTTITATQEGDDTVVVATPVEQVLNVKPQIPTATDATNILPTGFTANWLAANGAEAYYLYFSTDPDFTSSTVYSVGNVLTFDQIGYLPNTTYYYKLKSINSGIYSDYSNVISVTTGGDIVQVSNIVATPSFTGVHLSWDNGNLGGRAVFLKEGTGQVTLPDNYYHYYGDTDWDLKIEQLGESGYYSIYYGSDSSVDITNLYPGTLYTVQIFEYSGNEWEEVYLTDEGIDNPIQFTTWGTTTFTNTNGVSTSESWNSTDRWDHAIVPTSTLHSAVKVIIDGNCDVSADATANNLTINAPHDDIIPKLTVDAATSLVVTDSIINNGDASALMIKSSSSSPNGSLIFNNSTSMPVAATVEMYSKAFKDVTYKWQFFGIPVQSLDKYPAFVDGVNYARKYNEAGTGSGLTADKHWIQLQNGAILTPFTGYEVTQISGKTYSFSGNLVNGDYESGQLSYTSTAQYPGQHLIGNPYTAAINIESLEFGSSDAGIMENSVYLYNTGSYDDWTNAGSGTASTEESSIPGLYIVVPKSAAGTNGLPSQIPSMQAFLVKVFQADPTATLSIPYSSVGTITKNTSMQRVAPVGKVSTRIDVQGSNYTDKLWLISEETCSHGFDNGWDGYKEFGSTSAPQIYADEPVGDFQVNTVDDLNNTLIGFIPGSDDEYTMTFLHENFGLKYSALYLVDLRDNRTVDISEDGSQYTFTSSNIDFETRFKIVTSPGISTDYDGEISLGLNMYSVGAKIFLNNYTNYGGEIKILDVSGRLIKIKGFEANERFNFNANLKSGVYFLVAETSAEKVTTKVVVK